MPSEFRSRTRFLTRLRTPTVRATTLLATLLATLLTTLLTTPAAADVGEPQPPAIILDPIAAGRQHFKTGVQLYRQGASDAALAQFARAYQVAPNFRILYNLAQVQAQRQMYVEALTFFRRYLDEATAPISARRRRTVAANQAELMSLVGRLKLTHSTVSHEASQDPSSDPNSELIDDTSPFDPLQLDEEARNSAVQEATLFVDGVSRGSVSLNTPILLNAGVHQIRIEVEGYHPQVRSITLLGGEDISLLLLLDALPEPKVTPAPAPAPLQLVAIARSEPKRRLARSAAPLWLSLSATGVLVGATAALGIAAHRAEQGLNRELTRFPANRRTVDSQRNQVRLLAQATDMIGLFAIVSAGLSTYLFASRSGKQAEADTIALQAHPHATGMSLLCTGRF